MYDVNEIINDVNKLPTDELVNQATSIGYSEIPNYKRGLGELDVGESKAKTLDFVVPNMYKLIICGLLSFL